MHSTWISTWEFDDELLDLLWVLEHTVTNLPAAAMFARILTSELFKANELPIPTEAERRGLQPKGEVINLTLPGFEESAAADSSVDNL